MKTFITLAIFSFLLFSFGPTNAQNLIAVQNGNVPAFFQQVDSAIVHSQDDDTLYIPGGSWNISKVINKRLHLIGVGHHPDSTKVTFSTVFNSLVTLATGSSNGSMTGILLEKGLVCGESTYTISRCRILGYIHSNSNFTFFENIIDAQIGYSGDQYASNCSFFNNFINSYGNLLPNNSTFKNNIFSYLNQSQYSLFENNIFLIENFTYVSNSGARNNLFVAYVTFPNGTNVGSDNISGQNQTTIFVNQEGSSFNYTHAYHLQSTCPGRNAGTDGTDIGIYGGAYPWKEGSIPSNPHFQNIKIDPKTDNSGNLNVKIKVAAQDH